MRIYGAVKDREAGQAMIFFAILASAMFLMMGLAVEGGRVFVEYRHMQASVDMAALVGAQDLPCPGTLSCDSVKNEAYWCAFSNYYGSGNVPANPSVGCASPSTGQTAVSGPISVKVCVPPMSQSPYDGINYGTDPTCSTATPSSPGNGYIEVQMTQAIQVPIFNVSFNMYTHAIARHGEPSPKDFAMVMLDPVGNDIALAGTRTNGFLVVGSVDSDSTDASHSITANNTTQTACDGGWYTAANEPFSTVGSLVTGTNASPVFAPPACTFSGGSADNPTVWHPNWTYIADPYCSSYPPPPPPAGYPATNSQWSDCRGNSTGSPTTWSNCLPCAQLGWGYTWTTGSRDSGTWYRADSLPASISGGQNWEFFPGVYPSGIHSSTGGGSSAATIYFNPGVYTMESDLKLTGQTDACIYGAPACHLGNQFMSALNPGGPSDFSCSTADFGASNVPGPSSYTVTSASWYYYCSPWGYWDSHILSASVGAPSLTMPTFECPSTSVGTTCSGTSTPMNGVTFYLTNDASFDMEGSGTIQLAFPDPCPGTGTQSSNSIPFFDPAIGGQPAGAIPGSTGYTYPATSLPGIDNAEPENVYPSPDLTLAGECGTNNAGNEWPGEFGTTGTGGPGSATAGDLTQHLHFMVFARDGGSTIKLAGGSTQNFWGVLYNPGSASLTTSPDVSGCSSPTKCSIVMTGSSGGGNGPPMMAGQIVGDNFSYGGSAVTELFYRPCNPKTGICSTGPGSGLVQ